MAICSLQFGFGLMLGIGGTLLIPKIRQEYIISQARIFRIDDKIKLLLFSEGKSKHKRGETK